MADPDLKTEPDALNRWVDECITSLLKKMPGSGSMELIAGSVLLFAKVAILTSAEARTMSDQEKMEIGKELCRHIGEAHSDFWKKRAKQP